MIASIALMFLSAAAAATPCESLTGLKLDKATDHQRRDGARRSRAGARRRSRARDGQRTEPRAATAAGDDSGPLPRAARAQAHRPTR